MKKYLFILSAILCFAGCQKLEDTYKDMAGDGPIRYLGKCKDLTVKAGWERLRLTWENNIDPVISNVRVRWTSEEVEGEAILPRGTTEYDIVDLADGNYEIRVCSIDEKDNSSLEIISYGRPYTMNHEAVRSFSHVVTKHIFVKDRLILFFEGLPDNISDIKLKYTDNKGVDKVLPLGADEINPKYMLVDDLVDPAKDVIVERTGLIIESDGEVVVIPLESFQLENKRTMAVDFKLAIEARYGKESDNDYFVENLTELELDYSINSFEDILYFPNLKKLHLAKNRYQWDDGLGYNIIEMYGDVSEVYELEKSLFILDIAHELNGLTIDRYNQHFLPSHVSLDYLNEKGNPIVPARTRIDTSGWGIKNSIEDIGNFNSHLEYLFDGNLNTAWETEQNSTLNTHVIELDLKKETVVNGVQICQRRFNPNSSTGGTPYYLNLTPELISMQYSPNQIYWYDAASGEGNIIGNTVGEITEIIFPEPRTVRNFRITLSELSYASNFSITLAEIVFF